MHVNLSISTTPNLCTLDRFTSRTIISKITWFKRASEFDPILEIIYYFELLAKDYVLIHNLMQFKIVYVVIS